MTHSLHEREYEAHIAAGIDSRWLQIPERTYDGADAPRMFYDSERQTATFANQRFFRPEN
jgi:hypothetical protein